MGKPLYTVAELRAVEQLAMASLAPNTLMQRAGAAAAQLACALAGGPEARVLAVAGPGNNGGDALEAALQLCAAGLDAHVLLCVDASALTGDASLAWKRATAGGVPIHGPESASALFGDRWDLVLDGLFGIGLTRPLTGVFAEIVHRINALAVPVLSLDVPSGIDADTGAVVGPHGCAVAASHTLSFIGDKPGLHTGAARDHAGTVQVADLAIAPAMYPPSQATLYAPEDFAGAIVRRRHDSHKGSFGDVVVLGGARGMSGAPVLGARAALHCGAGRVFIAFLAPGLLADPVQPELMCRDAQDVDFGRSVLVAGPGMGAGPEAVRELTRALAHPQALVVDADGLNLIASRQDSRDALRRREAATVLTPHPLEAARLLQCPATEVQADRPAAARALAAALNAIVVLKGSGTVIARPDGQIAINGTGNPALATAGSGDVLAGITGALLAQGTDAWQASLAAVYLHGAAADLLVQQGIGPTGLVASELIPAVRILLNQLARPGLRPFRPDVPR